MIDKWFSTINLSITPEQFDRLPRNGAYKYEYFDEQAWLTPRPKSYHAVLDLRSFTLPFAMRAYEKVGIRSIAQEDWEQLPRVFAFAFWGVEPFAGLDDATRLEASRDCIQLTREGENGPLIEQASFVATTESDEVVVGGLLMTLLPPADLTDRGWYRWREPPPRDAVEKRLGRPHLTWIFVNPWFAGSGVGAALLAAAVGKLAQLGYTEMASTFLLGNESSTLWHWRMGFRLLPHWGSMRAIREEIAGTQSTGE